MSLTNAAKDLMNFIPKSSYSFDELIECGKGKLFGAGNAQLPLPPMLMFDRITHISEMVVSLAKGRLWPSWMSNPICGFLSAILRAIR